MSGDAERHRARREMMHKVGKAAINGKDVDHIMHIKNGGSNRLANLRVRSIHANRSDNGHKKGEKK